MPHEVLRRQIGEACITVTPGLTRTMFPDGTEVVARHDDIGHLDQAQTARGLGYADVEALNRDHDVTHSLLASWLGLPWSPVLRAKALGEDAPFARIEEAAVLAIQRFAVSQGIDLLQLLRTRS